MARTGTIPSETHSITQSILELKRRWLDAAFVAGWEAQSHLSGMVLVAFAAFGSFWTAMPAMLMWSLLATAVFHFARLRGRPDLLERTTWGTNTHSWRIRVSGAAWATCKAWLAGIQAFLYARMVCGVLDKPVTCWKTRAARAAVLGFGITVFGVPATHHILRRAGFEKGRLLKMGVLGTFLNVPYRVLASALLLNLLIDAVNTAKQPLS